MKVWVSGSLAYDRIMDFSGRFAEHINPKKLHVINLSFAAKTLELSFGGTAGNIAYGLRALGVATGVVGNLGRDGAEYLGRLKKLGVDIACVQVFRDALTAGAYITADRDDNQISAFFAGCMMKPCHLPKAASSDLAIISPDAPKNVMALARHYWSNRVPYIFDPGQQITSVSKNQLAAAIRHAWAVIGNDYEVDLINQRSGLKLKKDQVMITTYGRKGSKIETAGKTWLVSAVKAKKVVDPTGAGDAYRAGLLAGLSKGYDWKACGRLASAVAVAVVETQGTQNYRLNAKRLYSSYHI